MTHELKEIIHQAFLNQQNGLTNVLATVVFLEGSSYRKPGVRMLICENGKMTGAVSGGCVEKEIQRCAQSVFKDHKAKIIKYDGRYRLGCEGILTILIEPFNISEDLLNAFSKCNTHRASFQIHSYFKNNDNSTGNFGSVISFEMNQNHTFFKHFNPSASQGIETFTQNLQPCFKLLIIGGEHDAVKLCIMASNLGWEVDVITSIKDPKQLSDFPGAHSVVAEVPETIELNIDEETAVVLMTHNYALDLKYLLKLTQHKAKYIGVLGSNKRREQLENDMLNYNEAFSEDIFSAVYSPAGLNIGAITPEEIALSILAEILTVFRQKKGVSLRSISSQINSH